MRRKEIFLSIIILFAFIAFTLIVKSKVFDYVDFDLTVRIQNKIPRFFDTFFSFFSLIGSAEVITLFLLPVFLIYKLRSIIVYALYGAGLFVEVVGKTFLSHKGPPHLFFRYDLDFKFPSAYIETYHSYPSGHSYRTVFVVYIWIAIVLMSSRSKNLKILFTLSGILLCVIMLISRVSLGEHWTTDVVGGFLLGLGFAAAGSALAKKSPGETPRPNDKIKTSHST